MQLTCMLVIAFFLVSLKLVKEEIPNPYCKVSNQKIELELHYEMIDYYTYDIHCNTLNVEVFLIESATKEDAVALLLQIKDKLEDDKLSIMTHVMVCGNQLEDVIYASLNLGYEGISYIGNLYIIKL